MEYEESDRHRQALLEGSGLNDKQCVQSSRRRSDEKRTRKCWTKRRSLAAPLNYMSLDRSDVQDAAKEICTTMANRARGCSKKLKKACGCSKESGESRAWKHDVDVHVVSDWAKGPERKSTSGGMLMITFVEHGRSRVSRGHHRAA